jgi:hypothetical protein
MCSFATRFCLFLALAVAGVNQTLAAPPARPTDLNDLSLEVNVLLTLSRLDLSKDQAKALEGLAKGVAEKPTDRQPAKVSSKFRTALINLHSAIVKGDDAKINDAREKYEDLLETEDTELDDVFPVSEEAHARAGKFLRLLSPQQVAAYLMGQTLADPAERLIDGLEEVRGVEGEDNKKQTCEDVATEVAQLLAGSNSEQQKQIQEKATELLVRAQALKDSDFKKQKTSLEKEARKIVGEVSPIDVLGHIVENNLAELLANPRLVPALQIELQRKKD